MLVQVLLLARIPVLDRTVGFDRLTVWHRRNGKVALSLLIVHAAAITTGYAVGDGVSLPTEVGRLLSGYPGVITALAGLVILVAVVISSLVIVRRRLRYETWYFVHLYTYLAIALAFSHQIATGREFVGDPAARAYWQGALPRHARRGRGVPARGAGAAQRAPPAARRAGDRGGAGRRLAGDRRRAARAS